MNASINTTGHTPIGIKSGSQKRPPIIASLDIGTTKVCFVIGAVTPEGKIDIVGIGHSPNTGIRHGAVVNIEATTDAIRKAREEAELMSGYHVNEVWVGVSGAHITSFDSKGMVAIKNKEVTSSEIERVIEAAKAVAVPGDRTVLHVLPREYKVDGQDGIVDPIGMSGVRLEANVHIVTGSHSVIANTVKCVEKAGLKAAGLVLEQLAAAEAILSEDERNLGVCLVDMGGGSCKLIYIINGSVASSAVIPVGGSHFTHDIAVGLRTPQIAAEDLKRRYGSAMASLVAETETIEVEGVGGRKARSIPRRDLADIIEARAEEILNFIGHQIRTSGLMPTLGGGVVLTGGTSHLEGLVEMGEFVFDIPVRRGVPAQVGGLSDVVRTGEAAVAVGLLQYGFRMRKDQILAQHHENALSDSFDGMAQKIKEFFGQVF